MTDNVQAEQGTTLRKLSTKQNTSFEDWCALLIAELKRRKVNATKLTKLAAKHAWEYEDTPESFAMQVQHMNERAERANETKPSSNF